MFKRSRSLWSAPAERRSVTIRAAVESPNGTNHFASSPSRCNGEVQIARWSRRMFLKNRRSSDGVGDGCGVDVLAGVCPDALDVPAMMKMTRSNPRHSTLRHALETFDFITLDSSILTHWLGASVR